jgi:hypothetical protein
VIREIKDVIEKFAKEDNKSVSEIGLRFAGVTLAEGSDGDQDDRVLGEGILRMLNGPAKAEYVTGVQECLVRFRKFGELTEEKWSGLNQVENYLAKVHGNWQSWEGCAPAGVRPV